MQTVTRTVKCPACSAPAQLRVIHHVDEQGHPFKDDTLFVCLCGHRPTKSDVESLAGIRGT